MRSTSCPESPSLSVPPALPLPALPPRSGRGVLGVAVAAALSLGACGSDTGADPEATAVPVGDDGKTLTATKDGITAYLNAGDYRAWGKEPDVRDAVRAHGGRARSYFNAKYLQARRNDSYPMAVGAMSVKELYRDTSIYGYAVGVKTRAGSGAETWTWYETTGLPEVKYFGVANPTCEGCHGADGGRDHSLATTIP